MTASVRANGLRALGTVLLGVLAAMLAVAGAEVSLVVPLAAIAVFAVATLAILRPTAAVCLAILVIPLETLSASSGEGFGVSPAEFVSVAAAGGWLVHRSIAGGASLRSPLNAPVLALVLMHVPGMLLAADTGAVLKETVMWSAFYVLFLAVLGDERRGVTEWVATALAVAGGLAATIAVVKSLGTDQQTLDFGAVVTDRAAGSLGAPTLLAIFVVTVTPLQIVLAARARLRWVRMLCGALALISLVALVLALTRSAFIALAILAIWLVIRWRPARRIALVVLLLFTFTVITKVNPFERVVDTQLVVERIATIASPDTQTGEDRIQLWERTPDLIRDHPLFGVGADNFVLYAPQYRLIGPGGVPYDHAHNLVLAFLAQFGLLGLIVLTWLVIAIAIALRRGLRIPDEPERSVAIGLVGAFLAFAVSGVFDYVLSSNAFMLALVALIALAARQERQAREFDQADPAGLPA